MTKNSLQSISPFRETFYPFVCKDNNLLYVQMAGITHCDPDYKIVRTESQATFYVLEYVKNGNGIIQIGDQLYHAEPGDVYLLQTHISHQYHSNKEHPMEKIWFNISGSLIDALCDIYNLRHQVVYSNCNLEDDFMKGIEILSSGGENAEQEFSLLLHRIFLNLYRWGKKNKNKQKSPDGIRLKNYLDSHWQQKILLADLSKLISKSPVQTLRIFRRDFNTTPYAYLQNLRSFIACQYLENSNYSVKIIASILGFTDEYYFSNWFKEKNGTAPIFYKKQHTQYHKK